MEKCIDWNWLTDLEIHLSQHPRLLKSKISMCKMARFVREYPKEKGGKAYSRPVTVHCVNAHGIFMKVTRQIFRKTTFIPGRREAKKGIEMRNGVGERSPR